MASLPADRAAAKDDEAFLGLDPSRIVHTMPSAPIPKPSPNQPRTPTSEENRPGQTQGPSASLPISLKDRPTRHPSLTLGRRGQGRLAMPPTVIVSNSPALRQVAV